MNLFLSCAACSTIYGISRVALPVSDGALHDLHAALGEDVALFFPSGCSKMVLSSLLNLRTYLLRGWLARCRTSE